MFSKIYENANKKIKCILDNFSKNETIEKEDIIYILNLKEVREREIIFQASEIIKNKYTSGYISVKGVIEFTNYCKKNCTYCGIRRENKNINRYRMSIEEIIETSKNAAKWGLDTIILQGGEDLFFTDDMMISIIKQIKKETKLPVSISIGERPLESYRKFKRAGAIRSLLKHEAINKKIFDEVHPDKDYENRINLLRYMNILGYVAGSGNIIGLPKQTIEDIADDIIFMRDEKIKMIGIGPLIPSKNTPLENYKIGSADITLNAYAATRFAIPRVQLPTTTALGTISEELQFKAFEAGCNVIMVNITPDIYRKNYNIYDNKRKVEFFETISKIKNLGFKLSPITEKAIIKSN
ncbi:[FeFe] hydrogenase maturase subunit HydE [Tepiditoga spiralis]|uniref:[FeFe] hydrogenase maturase subunit HydE n=1 Tax=Tepiditoga spiralis TaxID=2108365 RepID=A0A7G1G7I7_9BACT|nr:[FeFe] hydrogenase H-cluster radical SAM maturase HydE [Tepiditoga spiralis]BBE30843.1 [FeFe] hydrogenase maturase subunit HydE [Tepiditoga spiralis]